MEITLRQEQPDDYAAVSETIQAAFKDVEFSDHKEHVLVERLRRSEAFVPALSIVAEHNQEIVGHILLTIVRIKDENVSFEALSLAPVSVKPEFQGRGIGRQLIKESHKVAGALGFKAIIVLGHEKYYPTFGYEPAGKYGIVLPFDAPAENCMVIALAGNGLVGIQGKVKYPEAFFE